MPITITSIATGVPKYHVSQDDACIEAKRVTKNHHVDAIYANTSIKNRYMCVSDFELDGGNSSDLLYSNGYGIPLEKRMQHFAKQSELAVNVCKEAIENAKINPQSIGKLIVVSSTGFYAPYLDCAIIKALGLPKSIDRCLVGFMGCAAAMNGIRVARDYVASHAGKAALVCCFEMSSVHIKFEQDNINDAIIHALFADGCASVVLQNLKEEDVQSGMVSIVDDLSILVDNTEDGITLQINQHSITCMLSKNLSHYIEKSIAEFVQELCDKNSIVRDESIEFWTIHPGGPRIIQAVEKGLGLQKEQTAISWKVLQEYGNMLSPSFLFVLQEQLKKPVDHSMLGIAVSFAPGVGIEGLLLKRYM